MSKVSVIVPVYNVEKEIHKCVDSLLCQNYSNYEIILIDDGSTDSCPQICDEYAKREKKISVVHKENAGAGSARNAGLSVAKGEYIMFVDSDDWTDSNFISVAFNKIIETQADLLMFGIKTVEVDDNSGKILKTEKWTQDYRIVEGRENCRDAFCELLFSTLLQSLYNKIYKMSIIKKNKISFPDIRRTQDAIFNMDYYKYIEKFVLIPDVLYFYKFEGNSIFKKFSKDSYKTNIYYDNYLVNLLKSWGKYSGKQRIRVDEIYMITMFRTFGFCRNPKWKMNINDRIEYIKNIVEEDYNVNRILDIVVENKEIKKMVKLVKEKKYKRIYLYLLTQTVYDENSNINKVLKTINKPIKKMKRKQ